ncbi:hypothetical protein BIY23_03485 [Wolbachia pipientis]|uniref:Acyl carrier protein n=1 Tax=Wolbachia pipientis TaxID=955 RepID=A0A1E7QJD1_WOLPI|nr:acyl carrier protein [Wolbachia pipientis]OEY86591.1 hypothetical protein BIY23_03485 [Wolbachia pipientis]
MNIKFSDDDVESFNDNVESKVKKIILKYVTTNIEKFNGSSNLSTDHKIDSLDAVEIIMNVEEEFGIEIPDEDAQNMNTMDNIVGYVRKKLNTKCTEE